MNCFLLIPTTVKSLLMVLNAMKKLLLQRLQIATLKVPHYVSSLTIALFILLNCTPFTLPLGSSASLRKKTLLVLSDSFSVLKSISNAKCDHPLLVDLFNLYFKLCGNKDIVFAWVPGQVGIRGNNVVDLAAKHALEKSINRRMAVPYSDFKVLTNVYVKKLWQTEWERYAENKSYKIQPKVDDPIPSHGRCRREETVLCRLHIGHTFLTHFLSFER